MSETKQKVDKYLGYASSALDLIPDLPGAKDDIAIGVAKGLIGVVREALKTGRSTEEIVAVLEVMVAEPAARFDIDAVVERWLAKKAQE